jgi:hypothetical protein
MTQKVFVLGMAKSSLKLKTAGVRRNLELDVLRMIYCLNHLNSDGHIAKGYILVHNNEIKDTIENKWFTKYDFNNINIIKILTFSELPPDTIQKMKNEKADNSSFKNSSANYSKKITEALLKTKIEEDYNKQDFSFTTKDINNFPSGINWDYYEILENKKSP